MIETPPFALALAAEHAAIFAYGPVGARLDGRAARLAREAEEAHRDRRDEVLLRLTAQGVPPPAAAASYALPFEVTDEADALRLAVQVEESAAGVWRALLARTDQDERRFALDALLDCAVRATGFRVAAGIRPATRVFPGMV